MMSLQSSLLGFAIFKLPIPHFLSPSKRPFTAQENVVVQTTAVATGTLPLAAVLVGIIPALEQLDFTLDGVGPMKLSFWQLIGWSIGICFFGSVSHSVCGSSCRFAKFLDDVAALPVSFSRCRYANKL